MPDSLTKSTNLPTSARLSLGNSTPTQSTADHLRFQLDHALARDAVHTPLDLTLIQTGLKARGLLPVLLHSGVDAMFSPNAPAAELRRTYLLRPDLGRTLHPNSVLDLQQLAHHQSSVISTEGPTYTPVISIEGPTHTPVISTEDPTYTPVISIEGPTYTPVISTEGPTGRSGETPVFGTTTEPPPSILYPLSSIPCPVLFLLADGLSALALERHALPLLDAVLPSLSSILYPLSPIVTNARVAIADPIGQILGAQITVLLIGERPGLSSPDSLGCYITWDPRPGRTDAERNCISNIRGPEGLSYAEAAHRIAHYIHEAQRLHTTGTSLKDPTTTPALP
jgi:ethanolamine ammonia-lyase small subunit